MRTSLISVLLLAACAAPTPDSKMLIAHLGATETDPLAIAEISDAFAARNPGYALSYTRQGKRFEADAGTRVVFVQHGKTKGAVGKKLELTPALTEGKPCELTVGDIIVLRPHHALATADPVDALVFDVPDPLDKKIPNVLRPDWDDGITDTPGGCATEAGAYRRVVLTWMRKNGPYNYHGLNAHRVRITNSFSHYHPVEGGFDEFYLVQMVQPGARIVTSDKTERIIASETVTAEEAQTLLQSTELKVGDLVYLPRGTMHRGLGGVLAHVISTPGFIPGSEIGVDHHLRQINERLGLSGDAALPFNVDASTEPLIR